MDHSVTEYVKRLPTEKLELFLRQCMQEPQSEDYAYLVAYIKQVLEHRYTQESSKQIDGCQK